MENIDKGLRTRRVPQKPVFNVQPFDPSNTEHLRGNITIVLNKALALEISKFIRESDLGADEGHIYALQSRICMWYKDRTRAIRSLKDRNEQVDNQNKS